jgi:adenylosuccinate lyase
VLERGTAQREDRLVRDGGFRREPVEHLAHLPGVGRGSGDPGRQFRDLLLDDRRVAAAMTPAELDALLDPAAYTGLAGAYVDRVVKDARRVTPAR